jgi:putative resolvase
MSEKLRVVYRDRLTRFGFDYLVQLLDELGVTVIVEDDEELPMQEELMRDFMSLIASFSGKYYKLRAVESKKKMLADLKAMI